MIVTDIRYSHTIVPKGSCGTGYSEPSVFYINGSKVIIDLWYRPASSFKKIFFEEVPYVENEEEAFRKFAEVTARAGICPYSEYEILTSNGYY